MNILEPVSAFVMIMNYNAIPLLSFTRKRTDISRNIQVIEEIFSPLKNKRILDIGCGRGILLKALANRLAYPTGIDVNRQSVLEAHKRCPQAEVLLAGAGNMEFEESQFDGAVFLNTLHHIPGDEIHKGLENSLRFTKKKHPVLVLEPLNFGSYFEVFKPLENETEVCANALVALHNFIASGNGRLVNAFEFMTLIRVNSIEHIIADAIAVDPGREKKIPLVRDEMTDLFNNYVQEQDGFPVLEHPMIALVLTDF